MQKQYETELKKLTAQLSKDTKQTDRQIGKLEKHRTSCFYAHDQKVRKIRKVADRDIARLVATHKKVEKGTVSTINTLTKAYQKREAALQRRIDILHGRLGS